MDRQLLLLGLLRRQEMHGYQLNEFIEEKMHFCIDLKKPTAYYLLDKLAQEGLLISRSTLAEFHFIQPGLGSAE